MFEFVTVSKQYLLILIARGWRLSDDLKDELKYSGYSCHDVIIHNSGKYKDYITGLK